MNQRQISRQSIPKKQQESSWPLNNFLNCCSKKDDEQSLDRELNMIPQKENSLRSYKDANDQQYRINEISQNSSFKNQRSSQKMSASLNDQISRSSRNLKVNATYGQSENQKHDYYGNQNNTKTRKESQNLKNVVQSQISIKNGNSRKQQENNDQNDFWNQSNLNKYLQIKPLHTKYQVAANNQYVSQSSDFVMNRYREIQKRNEEIKKQLYQQANQNYMLSKQKLSKQDQLRYEELSEIKEQIDFDIGWKIFDEVNQFNDVTKIIDLNCLDAYVATLVVHQKILDLAQRAKQEYDAKRRKGVAIINNKVLQILCGQSQIHSFEDFLARRSQIQQNDEDESYHSPNRFSKNIKNYKKNKTLPNNYNKTNNKLGNSILNYSGSNERNHIVEYLKQELKLDHFYLSEKLTVLVRVDEETSNQINDYTLSHGQVEEDLKSNFTSKYQQSNYQNLNSSQQNLNGQKRLRNVSKILERNEREIEFKCI